MKPAPLDEPERLRAVRDSELLDTPPEDAFDRLTVLAARMLHVPVAAVSIVDSQRQYFKSQIGLDGRWAGGTPLRMSFCQHVATTAAPLVVSDARRDPRVRDNEAVTELDVQAYAGMPIADPQGNVLGSLCVIDHAPRQWSDEELDVLHAIADSVNAEIELRTLLRRTREQEAKLRLLQRLSVAIAGAADFDSALRVALEEICDATGWRFGEVWLPRHGLGVLEASGVWYAADPGLEFFADARRGTTFARGEGSPGTAWANGAPVWVPDVRADPSHRRQDAALAAGFHATASLPILADGQVVAVLTFHLGEPRDADKRFVDLIASVAAQLGTVIRQKRVENVLHLQTVRLREQAQLIELASDAIIVRTVDGEIVYWNTGAEVLYGHARGDAIGEDVHALLATEYPQPLSAIRAQLERTGRWEGELIHRTAAGARITVESRWALQRDPQGRPTQVLELSTNVTERRRAEADRDRLARQLELILRSVADGICGVDAEGRMTFVNHAAQQMLGYDAQELIGRMQHDTIHHSYADGTPYPREACPMMRTLQGGGPQVSREEVFWRRDGTSFPVEYRSTPLVSEQGIFGAVITFRDISDRMRAERELIRARDDAERANRIKSEFLANMSHEIRTPMNGIIGMAELLLDTTLDRRQRDHLEMMQSSAESLLRIINDILDFSKMESGKLDLEATPLSLRASVGDAVRAHGIRAQQKGLQVTFRVDPALPDILIGDVGRLRQVVVNLLSNAIKFTEKGEIGVEVVPGDVPVPAGEIMLHVRVRDTGIGIPRARQQAIFEAFTQADSSTTRQYGGTGLGLSISSQLVRLMHGHMWVESWPGQGSTFHFTARLGVADQQTIDADPGTSVQTAVAGNGDREEQHVTTPQQGGMRVLLAEDNPVNRTVATGLLAKRGWPVTVATNGREAIDAIERALADGSTFDLVLMDVQMPEMDGIEATARIRALEQQRGLPRFPIVAVTAHAMAGDRERCLAAGMDAYVSKPLRPADLDEAIRHAIAARSGERTPAADPPPPAPAAMAAMLEDDYDLLRELAAVLMADLPSIREALGDAVANSDADTLRRVAHRVKGSASVFGAEAVTTHASAVEELATRGDVTGAVSRVPSLVAAIDALESALSAV